MVQTGNNQFFVYINTTTNVVNFIHINTSGSYLRHGTLSFVSLLYVLSPEMAGQMVVQMRVPEINLAHGLQAQAATIFTVTFSITDDTSVLQSFLNKKDIISDVP